VHIDIPFPINCCPLVSIKKQKFHQNVRDIHIYFCDGVVVVIVWKKKEVEIDYSVPTASS